MDKGVSQQLQPIIYPWPYDYLKEFYNCMGVNVVPSTLTWVSSNPSIASVDSNGVVTGKKPEQQPLLVHFMINRLLTP